MKFFASRQSFYNTRGDFITDTTTRQFIWGARYFRGVSAETIATPLYPPLFTVPNTEGLTASMQLVLQPLDLHR